MVWQKFSRNKGNDTSVLNVSLCELHCTTFMSKVMSNPCLRKEKQHADNPTVTVSILHIFFPCWYNKKQTDNKKTHDAGNVTKGL